MVYIGLASERVAVRRSCLAERITTNLEEGLLLRLGIVFCPKTVPDVLVFDVYSVNEIFVLSQKQFGKWQI